MQRELRETTRALDYLLTPDQIKEVKQFTQKLDSQLEQVIKEYSIVIPSNQGEN